MFEKVLRFLTEHPKANTFAPFRFYHCSQNSISPVSLRHLPLRSPTKTTYRKIGTQDPGLLGETLRWHPTLGPWGGTLR